MSDGYLALAALAFERFSLVAFALLLQHPWAQQRTPRYLCGMLVFSAILSIQPYIYFTPTQMLGLYCGCFGCLAAWAVLHWTLLEDLNRTPNVLEVFLSPFKHVTEGVIKVHQRSLKHKAQPPSQPGSPSVWSLLQDAAVTWLICAATYEVGLPLLCYFSNNMCSSTYSSPSWLVSCAFAFPAGILLTQQLEVMYGYVRMLMILLGLRFPALVQLAAQMPRRALNWPVAASSVSELWAFRWHQFLRFYFEGFGAAAVNAIFPSASGALRTSMRCVAAFAMSGLLHEYLLWAVFDSASGLHMAFFMLNCAAVLVENLVPQLLSASVARKWLPSNAGVAADGKPCTVTAHVTPASRGAVSKAGGSSANSSSSSGIAAPAWFKHAWTLSFFILLSPLFVEPYRAAGFFAERAFHPLGTPVVPMVSSWVQG
jgi:hypothetical protein